MPKVVVYLGPARSGKTHELLRQYRDELRKSRPLAAREECFSRSETPILGRTLWLAPNARTANLVRGRLLENGLEGCLGPGVLTFDRLAKTIVDESPRHRSIGGLLERELLRRIARDAVEQGKLVAFAAAAERAGFIDLLAEHIDELQRRGVSPADYAKASPPRGDASQHAELAHLYSEYVRRLAAHHLLDAESTHAAARDLLADGACGPFKHLALVVVDGFTDFTRTQHEILRLLSRRATRLLVSLPDDPDSSPRRTGRLSDQSEPVSERARDGARADLFGKTAATLRELRRYHPELEIQRFAARSSGWPAGDYLAENIFRPPGEIRPHAPEVLESLDRVELIEAAGAQDEIMEIGRRVKRRLIDGGARPADIVVVFRSLAEAAPRVREVFDRFGIPYYLESHPRLMTAPVVKTLLALLWLDADDWPFRRVVSIITNNTLAAFDDEARLAADWLVRDLQIDSGKRKLLQQVDQLAADPEFSELAAEAERRTSAARAAQPIFALLNDVFAELPEEATPTQWTAALAQAGAALGLAPFNCRTDNPVGPFANDLIESNDGQDCPSYDTVDHSAWQSIARHLAALERLDSWLDQSPRTWSRRDLTAMLTDVVTHEALPPPHDEVGRVRVLAAPAARNIRARHLYLAGMSEQAFPAAEPAGRLATENDYRFASRVADQELAAAPGDDATRSQAEMLLFYELVSRADQSLTISYPALDEKAQILPASPYVTEIERILGEDGLKRIVRSKPQLSPVPYSRSAEPRRIDENACRSARGTYSVADWRVQAVAEALEGEKRLLAGLLSDAANKPLAETLEAGIRMVHARARGDSFGPAEGLLASPAAAARLAHRFGPQHTWSPSQWETYAACPYKFFLESVLRLQPLGELVLETDYARRGSRLHHILAAFHRQWSEDRADGSLCAADKDEFFDQLRQTIEQRMGSGLRAGIDAALLELDRRQIEKWAARHFDHHLKYDGACMQRGVSLRPRHFEFRFGPPRKGDFDCDPQSTSDAFIIDTGSEQIRVTGQIDRVDVGEIGGKTYFSVIDYKSSKKARLKQEHIDSGERLQLPIYVEAAQALIFRGAAEPLVAGYWSMASGFDEKGALAVVAKAENDDRWENVRETVRRLVGEFVGGIRRGEFPVFSRDDHCTGYCEFRTVCRVAQIRSLKKNWPPDGASAFGDT